MKPKMRLKPSASGSQEDKIGVLPVSCQPRLRQKKLRRGK